MRDRWTVVLGGFAALNLANALWMLADPASWYHGLPAAVPHTGPLNEHFVRDIGCAFTVVAAALLWAALRSDLRRPMVAIAGLFYLLHGLVHVFDTASGRLPPSHWAIDFPGVYLPILFFAVILAALPKQRAQD